MQDQKNLQENFDVTADSTNCTKIKQSHLPPYKAAMAHRTNYTDRKIIIKFLSGLFSRGVRWVNRTLVLFAAKLGVTSVDT